MKTIKSSAITPTQSNSEAWFDSRQQDIDRLIERLITPYIDYGNVALHHDELRNECWWKVATLLSSGTLERCKTQQQFFGFLKVCLRNHINSHVRKHAFTMKRTGVHPAVLDRAQTGVPSKTVHVRVDDPTVTFQLSSSDSGQELAFLLQDFERMLTPAEAETLFKIINSEGPATADTEATGRLRRRFQLFIRAEPESWPALGTLERG